MNILVLTSNYKADDLPKGITPVVNYFTSKWVSAGHRVIVIHNQTVFPPYMYFLLGLFDKVLANKVGYDFATRKYKERSYKQDRVKVFRLNMLKSHPQGAFPESSYVRQKERIQMVLKEEQFMPDVIVGHWLTPQLRLLSELKQIYHKPTCLVVHEGLPVMERDYTKHWKKYLQDVDLFGYRSKKIKEYFGSRYKVINSPYFMCYSGVPEAFVSDSFKKELTKPITHFTFIGTLIKRKHPEALLLALQSLPEKKDWKITYIGEGYLSKQLSNLIFRLKVTDKVFLKGRVEREEVCKVLKQTDVFVMISKGETFGLVYLEAMAHGCITIASRDEGMDGMIEDGVNGFLCKAGDVEELSSIIKKINLMDPLKLASISYQAYLTAQGLTDTIVAQNYLNELEKISKQ